VYFMKMLKKIFYQISTTALCLFLGQSSSSLQVTVWKEKSHQTTGGKKKYNYQLLPNRSALF
ncbi:unnamed protein product, partial [Candidula unifasciata]